VSDQHATFDTQVIAATAAEAPHVLDGILGNATDLPLAEHATDTHGATLANFALFDLVGKQLSPRRRRIGRQLNKGENIHTLQRNLAHAHEGTIRRRHPGQQSEQMWCLTLATNAIVCWMIEYHGLAVTALRDTGRQVDDEVLAHIWPTHHENVHLYGTHTVDIDAELARLDANGYRPLRTPDGEHQPPR
jgi:TnpA family transposase